LKEQILAIKKKLDRMGPNDDGYKGLKQDKRDLWTQYTAEMHRIRGTSANPAKKHKKKKTKKSK
jgi:hypothetical protein